MSEIIDKEFEYARDKFCFDIIKDENGEELVALTRRNVALAEAMIMNNSSYLKCFDLDCGPKGKRENKNFYCGSTAYCMNELKYFYDNDGNLIEKRVKEGKNKKTFKNVVLDAVKAVDRENSTHLNADRTGIDEITNRIFEKRADLVKYFGDVSKGFELIDCIKKKTNPTTKKGRANYSFATKFCHYGSFFFFNDDRKDNYSIYDGVMEKKLPLYLKMYNINFDKNEFKVYENYYKYVGDIIERVKNKTGEEISRNGFDHLIWYYYKGRI